MLIVELEDRNTCLDEVKPFDLITVVMERATLDTNLECMDLIMLRNAPLVFDTNTTISLQCTQHSTHIKDLLCVHKTEMIEMNCILEWFCTSSRQRENISRAKPQRKKPCPLPLLSPTL
jgi:hypothetical protein